jgi:hypothetical protein
MPIMHSRRRFLITLATAGTAGLHRIPRALAGEERLETTCAVTRRRFSSGCKAHPATAPAGSSRSRHGGDEMSEAFG